ncbi:gliding motility-associated ABC transporter permease subunit GldF [Aureibaculum sp. 2210JD6-5]|uniref:gliding motility-associated ABC transporter permease subunit GldF n=1 Tax=Aureibaculum sp. 2210JD6-5 TaxID=3103957 RepID=UPI002AAD0801|nr:gliding motility-associated ABC transporter permease subunit GldF [Aureibaculum sp. 2210JD6-5]MDY7396647.1 gliding motility-associated ABC transporter permease subunit GldF [Aureibaculum sp. 2210JD6-5]
MLSILKKELNSFFASPIGYLVIAVFLVINGLFLWVFNGDFNILNAGFADLNSFFFIAPWFFLFLIPAITMRTFSDEFRLGTIEILKTKPISKWQIVLGKFFGALTLIILALIPTLIYAFSVLKLGNPSNNLDIGTTVGSYIGLLFIAGAYSAIGIFTSTFSNNQIVAFIIAVLISFFIFYGFEALADMNISESLRSFGMYDHFKSISRGVIDTKDIVYFLSVTIFFLFLTRLKLDAE